MSYFGFHNYSVLHTTCTQMKLCLLRSWPATLQCLLTSRRREMLHMSLIDHNLPVHWFGADFQNIPFSYFDYWHRAGALISEFLISSTSGQFVGERNQYCVKAPFKCVRYHFGSKAYWDREQHFLEVSANHYIHSAQWLTIQLTSATFPFGSTDLIK